MPEPASAGQRLGDGFRPPRPRAGSTIPSRSGTSCGRSARSPTPTASRASICRRATRTCALSPTIPSTSPRARWSCARCTPPSDSGAPPITSDPPRHRLARMVLLPPFTPQAIDRLRPARRASDLQRADRRASSPRARCDAAVDYAQHIPVKVIAHMLGIPESDGDRFRGWIKAVLQDGITDDAALMHGFEEMTRLLHRAPAWSAGKQSRRRPHQLPRAAELPRRPPVHRQPRAGLACGCCWWPASTPPGAASARASGTWPRRPRTAAGSSPSPALMPTAIEEFLRAYSPVTMAREVAKETRGRRLHLQGRARWCCCRSRPPTAIPAMFPDADKVIIDRKENRHAAFGLGIHRCVGSNLARMEMTVAVEEFLKRIPEFRLAGPVTWSEGSVRGPRQVCRSGSGEVSDPPGLTPSRLQRTAGPSAPASSPRLVMTIRELRPGSLALSHVTMYRASGSGTSWAWRASACSPRGTGPP